MDGVLYAHPRPASPHAVATSVLGGELGPPFGCGRRTRTFDRVQKLPIYGRERVGHVWLVDPLARTLEIFRLDGEGYRLAATHADDAPCRAEPFDAIELDLAALWQR